MRNKIVFLKMLSEIKESCKQLKESKISSAYDHNFSFIFTEV